MQKQIHNARRARKMTYQLGNGIYRMMQRLGTPFISTRVFFGSAPFHVLTNELLSSSYSSGPTLDVYVLGPGRART